MSDVYELSCSVPELSHSRDGRHTVASPAATCCYYLLLAAATNCGSVPCRRQPRRLASVSARVHAAGVPYPRYLPTLRTIGATARTLGYRSGAASYLAIPVLLQLTGPENLPGGLGPVCWWPVGVQCRGC